MWKHSKCNGIVIGKEPSNLSSNLDEAVCILHSTDNLRKCMNLSIHPPDETLYWVMWYQYHFVLQSFKNKEYFFGFNSPKSKWQNKYLSAYFSYWFFNILF